MGGRFSLNRKSRVPQKDKIARVQNWLSLVQPLSPEEEEELPKPAPPVLEFRHSSHSGDQNTTRGSDIPSVSSGLLGLPIGRRTSRGSSTPTHRSASVASGALTGSGSGGPAGTPGGPGGTRTTLPPCGVTVNMSSPRSRSSIVQRSSGSSRASNPSTPRSTRSNRSNRSSNRSGSIVTSVTISPRNTIGVSPRSATQPFGSNTAMNRRMRLGALEVASHQGSGNSLSQQHQPGDPMDDLPEPFSPPARSLIVDTSHTTIGGCLAPPTPSGGVGGPIARVPSDGGSSTGSGFANPLRSLTSYRRNKVLALDGNRNHSLSGHGPSSSSATMRCHQCSTKPHVGKYTERRPRPLKADHSNAPALCAACCSRSSALSRCCHSPAEPPEKAAALWSSTLCSYPSIYTTTAVGRERASSSRTSSASSSCSSTCCSAAPTTTSDDPQRGPSQRMARGFASTNSVTSLSSLLYDSNLLSRSTSRCDEGGSAMSSPSLATTSLIDVCHGVVGVVGLNGSSASGLVTAPFRITMNVCAKVASGASDSTAFCVNVARGTMAAVVPQSMLAWIPPRLSGRHDI